MSKKLTDRDFCDAAKLLRCTVADIQAVAEVESLGHGFDSQGRPVILFERHKFHKYTQGKFSKDYPDISNRIAGGYGRSSAQYGRFSRAFALNAKAAMMSASWGKFQIMGFNHAIVGFLSVNDFVDAMKTGERAQLMAFVEFILHSGLDDELRNHQWAKLARGYNGAGYKKNKYDVKLAAAYHKYNKNLIDCSQVPEKEEEPDGVLPPDEKQTDVPISAEQDASGPSVLVQAGDKLTEIEGIGKKLGGVSKSSWATLGGTWAVGVWQLLRSFYTDNPFFASVLIIAGIAAIGFGIWYLTHSKNRDVQRKNGG